MLKARIARKKRALRAIRGQKARKTGNIESNKCPVTADKRPKQPERYENPVDRNGAKGATIGQ